jgi:hypothetical protein
MKKNLLRPIAIFLLLILLAGCGNLPATLAPTTPAPATEIIETEAEATPTAVVVFTDTSTSTPDPCSKPQLETEVQKVHKHMREFDDASILASSMPRDQLGNSIEDLQRIRREAEDEEIPACLTNLKAIQVQHMNTVISTLLAFMRVSDPLAINCNDFESNTEAEAICQSISIAGEQHDQYILELAQVLGLTAVAATPPSAPSETPTP